MSQFLPADHSKGDANTLGGYAAVHARPAAFEGQDGASYSVEIMTDATADAARPFAGFLLFVRWAGVDPVASGHVESEFLRYGHTEEEARVEIGAMLLSEVRALLNQLISTRDEALRSGAPASRPWWESMHDEMQENNGFVPPRNQAR